MAGRKIQPSITLETDSDSDLESEVNTGDVDDEGTCFEEHITSAQKPRQTFPYIYYTDTEADAEQERVENLNENEEMEGNENEGASLSADSTLDSIASDDDDSASLQSFHSDEISLNQGQDDGSESDSVDSHISVESDHSVGEKRKLSSIPASFGQHALLQYHFKDLQPPAPPTDTATKPKASRGHPSKRSRTEEGESPEQQRTSPRAISGVRERTSDEQDAYIVHAVERWNSKRMSYRWNNVATVLGLSSAEVKQRWEKLRENGVDVPTSILHTAKSALNTVAKQDKYILDAVESTRSERGRVRWKVIATKLGWTVDAVRVRHRLITSTKKSNLTDSKVTDSTSTKKSNPYTVYSKVTTDTSTDTSPLVTTSEQDTYILAMVQRAKEQKRGVHWKTVARRFDCSVETIKAHYWKLIRTLNSDVTNTTDANNTSNTNTTSASSSSSSSSNVNASNNSSTNTEAHTQATRISNTTSNNTVNNTTHSSVVDLTIEAYTNPVRYISANTSMSQYVLQCVHAQSWLLHTHNSHTNNHTNQNFNTNKTSTTIHANPTPNRTTHNTTSTSSSSSSGLSSLWRQLGVELGVRESTLEQCWQQGLQSTYWKEHSGQVPATAPVHPGHSLTQQQTQWLCGRVYAWKGHGVGLWKGLGHALQLPAVEVMLSWAQITPLEVQYRWVEHAHTEATYQRSKAASEAVMAQTQLAHNTTTNTTASTFPTVRSTDNRTTTKRTPRIRSTTAYNTSADAPLSERLSPPHIEKLRRLICLYNLTPIANRCSVPTFWRSVTRDKRDPLAQVWRNECAKHPNSVTHPLLCTDMRFSRYTPAQDVALLEGVRRMVNVWGRVHWGMLAHTLCCYIPDTTDVVLAARWSKCIKYNTVKVYKHVYNKSVSSGVVRRCVTALVGAVELFHVADHYIHINTVDTSSTSVIDVSTTGTDITSTTHNIPTSSTHTTHSSAGTVEFQVAGLLVDIITTVVVRCSVSHNTAHAILHTTTNNTIKTNYDYNNKNTNTNNTNTNTNNTISTSSVIIIPTAVRQNVVYSDMLLAMLVEHIYMYYTGTTLYATHMQCLNAVAATLCLSVTGTALYTLWITIRSCNWHSAWMPAIQQSVVSTAYTVHILVKILHSSSGSNSMKKTLRALIAQTPRVGVVWGRELCGRPGSVYRYVQAQAAVEPVPSTTSNTKNNPSNSSTTTSTTTNSTVHTNSPNTTTTNTTVHTNTEVTACMNEMLTSVHLTLTVDTLLLPRTVFTKALLQSRTDNDARCAVECVLRGIVCAVVDTLQPAHIQQEWSHLTAIRSIHNTHHIDHTALNKLILQSVRNAQVSGQCVNWALLSSVLGVNEAVIGTQWNKLRASLLRERDRVSGNTARTDAYITNNGSISAAYMQEYNPSVHYSTTNTTSTNTATNTITNTATSTINKVNTTGTVKNHSRTVSANNKHNSSTHYTYNDYNTHTTVSTTPTAHVEHFTHIPQTAHSIHTTNTTSTTINTQQPHDTTSTANSTPTSQTPHTIPATQTAHPTYTTHTTHPAPGTHATNTVPTPTTYTTPLATHTTATPTKHTVPTHTTHTTLTTPAPTTYTTHTTHTTHIHTTHTSPAPAAHTTHAPVFRAEALPGAVYRHTHWEEHDALVMRRVLDTTNTTHSANTTNTFTDSDIRWWSAWSPKLNTTISALLDRARELREVYTKESVVLHAWYAHVCGTTNSTQSSQRTSYYNLLMNPGTTQLQASPPLMPVGLRHLPTPTSIYQNTMLIDQEWFFFNDATILHCLLHYARDGTVSDGAVRDSSLQKLWRAMASEQHCTEQELSQRVKVMVQFYTAECNELAKWCAATQYLPGTKHSALERVDPTVLAALVNKMLTSLPVEYGHGTVTPSVTTPPPVAQPAPSSPPTVAAIWADSTQTSTGWRFAHDAALLSMLMYAQIKSRGMPWDNVARMHGTTVKEVRARADLLLELYYRESEALDRWFLHTSSGGGGSMVKR